MHAYRDQYASLFRDGQDVVLLAISNDSAEELASWAKDDDFQFLFGSDPTGAAYSAFGGVPRASGMVASRTVIVIDPEGRIAEVIPRFDQGEQAAYDELSEIIGRVSSSG